MTPTLLSNHFYIIGYDQQPKVKDLPQQGFYDTFSKLLFVGHTEQIPKKIAQLVAQLDGIPKGTPMGFGPDYELLDHDIILGYVNYSKYKNLSETHIQPTNFDCPVKSVQSATDKEFCVIYSTVDIDSLIKPISKDTSTNKKNDSLCRYGVDYDENSCCSKCGCYHY
jgi:hypothetical protein